MCVCSYIGSSETQHSSCFCAAVCQAHCLCSRNWNMVYISCKRGTPGSLFGPGPGPSYAPHLPWAGRAPTSYARAQVSLEHPHRGPLRPAATGWDTWDLALLYWLNGGGPGQCIYAGAHTTSPGSLRFCIHRTRGSIVNWLSLTKGGHHMEYVHAGSNKQCLKRIKHSHMNIQREVESFAVASCLRKASISFFCVARSCPEKILYMK